MKDLDSFKKEINLSLNEFLEKKIASLPSGNENTQKIWEYVLEFLKEGKRIRSYIAYIGYKYAGGDEDKKAINLFICIELFHAFCLVHDDIMDEADIRHGMKTIHEFAKEIKTEGKEGGTHFGNSIALLVGDSLLAWTLEVLFINKNFSLDRIDSMRRIFFKMGDEVLLGQMLDLDLTQRSKASEKMLMQKILLKTAGYSFVHPLIMGANLVSEDRKRDEVLRKFAKHLGIAFQIQDDLLDIAYDEKQTFKSNFNDIAQKQHTYFTAFIQTKGTPEQKKILHSLFGKKLTDVNKKDLRRVFDASGAIEYGNKMIRENFQASKELLKNSDNPYSIHLLALIEKLWGRTS